MFADIDYFLRDLSRGIGRIQNGEVPDGSGNQIGNNGTLTDYWFKPGISDPFIAYMSKGAGAGGKISSTIDQDKGFINLGDTEYIDEDGKLTGFNVTAPAAAVHIQPGVSGTTTLVPSGQYDSSVPPGPATNWDGTRTGSGGTFQGNALYTGVNADDDDTSYDAILEGVLGNNPQEFNMSGTVLSGKVWNCRVKIRTFSPNVLTTGTIGFEIIDQAGRKYTKSPSVDITGLTSAWTYIDFTLDCTGSGTAMGANDVINSISIGLAGQVGVTAVHILCTYIQISTGGNSDVARWNSGAAVLLGKINSEGKLGVNTSSDALSAFLTTKATAATDIVSIFKGFTAQSGNLTEWQNVSGTILSRIKSDGTFDGPISTTSAISVTDNTFSILDNLDNTKIAQFQCATIGAGTTKTFTFPNASGTLPTLENAHTVTGAWTVGDGSGTIPFAIQLDGSAVAYANAGLVLRDITSGFSLQLGVAGGAGLSADRFVSLPDANAILVGTTETVTLGNKTLATTCSLRCSSVGTGVSFQDNTTQTKRLYVTTSGAVGNNGLTLSNTAARVYTLSDYTSSAVLVGNTTTAAGTLGKSDLTAQTGNIGATTLLTSSANSTGAFRVSFILKTTTAGSAGSTVKVTVAFNDGAAQTADILLTNAIATPAAPAVGHDLTINNNASYGEAIVFSAASNAITFTTTGTYNTAPQYTLRARIEALG